MIVNIAKRSLMLAHECVAEKAPEVGKSNHGMRCCDSAAAGFKVCCTLTSFLQCDN